MKGTPEEILSYWNRYLTTLGVSESVPDFDFWHFGESERMANDLAELVRRGIKTATSSLGWKYEEKGWREPKAGDRVVITYWDGRPACIIEITEAVIKPFDQIDENFTRDYGEGDRNLAWWRKEMWDYYSGDCREFGRHPSPKMLIACQRFRLLYK